MSLAGVALSSFGSRRVSQVVPHVEQSSGVVDGSPARQAVIGRQSVSETPSKPSVAETPPEAADDLPF